LRLLLWSALFAPSVNVLLSLRREDSSAEET
jgi:hypothetical protein